MNAVLIPDVTLTFSPECCKEYKGMAFDGNYFFLTVPSELTICKFSLDFILCCLIHTCRPYTSIRYDNKELCFWAWSGDFAQTLFKLDRDMKEISSVKLCPCDASQPGITAVSYHRQTNTFLAASTDTIAEYKKNGQLLHTLQKAENGLFSSILSVLSCCIAVCDGGEKQVLQFFTFQGQLIKSAFLPDTCHIIDIASHPCPEPDKKAIILSILAAGPDRTMRVLRCKIDLCDISPCKCQPKCESECGQKESCGCGRKYECECSQKCECKLKCECKNKCTGSCHSTCGSKHNCNCKAHCKCGNCFCNTCKCDGKCNCDCKNDCGCSCKCNCKCGCCDCQSCCASLCSLLESIALNEAALSHILNAEGEKLQKAVRIADSIHDLLEIDRSVSQTITRVTFLEQTLYAKLEAVKELQDGNCCEKGMEKESDDCIPELSAL
ncbi:hypothetical protein [Eisenbergiella sp.]